MQEKVCIVLNERETAKAKTAESLVVRLKEFGITASRINIDENIVKILQQKKPRILILDYLLGDFSTGLDVLNALQKFDPQQKPRVIFLTDEPSVQVAVQAMRQGASHYFELEHPQAVSNVAREVLSIIQSLPNAKTPEKIDLPSLDELTAQSKASLDLINRARVMIKEATPICIIQGAAGSGKTTLATALSFARKPVSLLQQIDLKFSDQELGDLNSLTAAGLAVGQSLLLENAEEDDGSILDLIASQHKSLWPNQNAKHSNSYLLVTCSSAACANAWRARLSAEILKITPLKERKEDIPLLVQRFVREAQELSALRLKPFETDVYAWIAELEWPGELKQLRNCIIHAAIDVALSESDPRESIETQRACWQQQTDSEQLSIEPYSALMALEMANFSYRRAAAKLGCSIKQLKESLP